MIIPDTDWGWVFCNSRIIKKYWFHGMMSRHYSEIKQAVKGNGGAKEGGSSGQCDKDFFQKGYQSDKGSFDGMDRAFKRLG
jgi:hypothetical protein